MAEYIDVDELIEALNGLNGTAELDMAFEVVENAPTVKAVPIDRLKDFRNKVINMNSVAIIQRLDKLIEESEE